MNTLFCGEVTISFDPSVDEQREVVEMIARAYGVGPGGRMPAAGSATVDGWTPAAMERYVAALEPVARTLLQTILRTSPCPTQEAQDAAGLSRRQYTDAHVGLQESLQVVPEVTRLPFDVVAGCFTLHEDVARLIAGALGSAAHRG